MKEKLNGKIYEWTDCECPVCGHYFDYDSDKPDYVTKATRYYNGENDCFSFTVFVKCKNCGKRYYFEDGN